MFAVTLVLSLIYISIFAFKALKTKSRSEKILLITLIIVTLIITSPQVIIASAGEMHAYPSLLGAAMIYGVVFQNIDLKKKLKKRSLS